MQSTLQKLEILGSSAKYDICAATSVNCQQIVPSSGSYIGRRLPTGCCHVYTADGRCVSLFKVLLTNKCVNDCFYCENATSCLKRENKTAFTPEELVKTFLEFYTRNYVEGLFLSSAICGDSDATMPSIIDVGRLLREKHQFQGYMHMKVLPGASLSHIKELSLYADRISINLEAPAKSFLADLSSTKDFNSDLLTRLSWMHAINKRSRLPAGLTTQMIVGGSTASDHDILNTTYRFYKNYELKRVYYSAFYPVEGSQLEHLPSTPLLREHRLYQADWLLRVYKFDPRHVLPGKGENLPLQIDPKTNYALGHYNDRYPVEINEATYADLLYVPGIGPKSARRVITLRAKGIKIEKESMLRALGVVVSRAGPFLKINGRRHTRLDEWILGNKIQDAVHL